MMQSTRRHKTWRLYIFSVAGTDILSDLNPPRNGPKFFGLSNLRHMSCDSVFFHDFH